jgi:predicted nicotinamide N-methyase
MTFEERLAFVREHTLPAVVPLAPELTLHQATQVTPLWHATAAELERTDPAPFWAFPWAGGQALARYLLDHPAVVRGRAVFDFASGSGLVGIAAARAGASRVTASDHDPFCEAAIQLNAALNGVAVEFAAGVTMGDALEGFDVVVVGDVFYERPLAENALAWLRRLAARGHEVLAGDPGRIYSPTTGTHELAGYDVPTSPEIESGTFMRGRVLRILAAG